MPTYRSLLRMFGSLQLVQEVSSTGGRQSNGPSPAVDDKEKITVDNIDASNNMANRESPYIHTSIHSQPSLIDNSSYSAQGTDSHSATTTTSRSTVSRKSYLEPPATQSGLTRVSSFPLFPLRSTSYSKSYANMEFNGADIQRPGSHLSSSRRYSKSADQTELGDNLAIPEPKQKSHKLLCLWPLPIITRYTITISAIISSLNAVGLLHTTCSAPIYVLYRYEVLNLLVSPFLFDFNMPSILFHAWNMLLLGLFEESLTHVLGGTRAFVNVLLGSAPLIFTIRNVFGYVFSKSTGFAIPILFFNDALHECSSGFLPFLFSLLVVQSLSINDKYILLYGSDDANNKFTVRKVSLQLAMCLLNFAAKNVFWWSFSGLLSGIVVTLIAHYVTTKSNNIPSIRLNYDGQTRRRNSAFDKRLPTWRLLLDTLIRGLAIMILTFLTLLLCNLYYKRPDYVSPAAFGSISDKPQLLTFVTMSAPRRGNPDYLSETLQSYLNNWPSAPSENSVYSRIKMLVYTNFAQHTQFELTREQFSQHQRGQQYIQWVQGNGTDLNQRLHVSRALELATSNDDSAYIALMEDDFPICGRKEWKEFMTVVYKANRQYPNHCGVFVGTGGSGLIMKPNIAKKASKLLMQYQDLPPDIILQKCLLGELEECQECSNNLISSKRLLMHHIGYNASTSDERSYNKNEFQCGWRHPFNGNPSVTVL